MNTVWVCGYRYDYEGGVIALITTDAEKAEAWVAAWKADPDHYGDEPFMEEARTEVEISIYV